MKIAYLIQCHKSAEQINELIKRLSADTEEYNTDFYIHVDAKSDICDKIITAENIILLKKRVNVKWGHISQVEATLELMSTAVNANKGYDYLWLISGQDYPIKSNKFIWIKNTTFFKTVEPELNNPYNVKISISIILTESNNSSLVVSEKYVDLYRLSN